MPPITDSELASQIKAKVAELNELNQKAIEHGLLVDYDYNYTSMNEKGALIKVQELKAEVKRITVY